MSNYLFKLQSAFPSLNFESNVELAPFTQVKLGGPAEVFFDAESIEDLIKVVQFGQQQNIPITMLGWGANTLIADQGLDGLVIRNRSKFVDFNPKLPKSLKNSNSKINKSDSSDIRFHQTPGQDKYSNLEYSEQDLPTTILVVDSGAPLPWLINHSIDHGLTGLQWFARIPATLGGAVVNNIHGGKHFLSELILGVEIIDETGELKMLSSDQLKFGYDTSIFHYQRWVITRVFMQLTQGDVDKAKQVVTTWSTQKKHQPQRSLGCIFQNLDASTQQKLNLPTPSVGYFLDQILGLKNTRNGKAVISSDHAAFIVSEPGCSSADYLALIKLCIKLAKAHGVQLKPEIFFKGFTTDELSDIMVLTKKEK